MIRQLFLVISILFLGTQVNGQELLWEMTYGGNKADWILSAFQNKQGNYVFSGYSSSGISGDKTENSKGEIDLWIIETDLNGNILWQKTIGGVASDKIIKTLELEEGGYLLAGESNSGVTGDKDQPTWQGRDLWLVRLEPDGDIKWQQTYGSTALDDLSDIISTRDGGYILTANSASAPPGADQAYLHLRSLWETAETTGTGRGLEWQLQRISYAQ